MALLAPSVWAGILHFKAEKAYFPFFVVSFKSLSSDPGYLFFTSPAFNFVFFSEAEDWTNSTHTCLVMLNFLVMHWSQLLVLEEREAGRHAHF